MSGRSLTLARFAPQSMRRAAEAAEWHGSRRKEATRTSLTSAPDITATVAPFRAWRDLRLVVAKRPMRATIGPGTATDSARRSARLGGARGRACYHIPLAL